MVLVSYKPNSYTGILQTKLSDREGHEARQGGLETMPLDQHIEERHGEGETSVEIAPAPVHPLLQVAPHSQHRQPFLGEHADLPLAARTQFEVGRIPLGGMEG